MSGKEDISDTGRLQRSVGLCSVRKNRVVFTTTQEESGSVGPRVIELDRW